MKIDNQDIIRAARQLRDEENEQLNVRPWNSHRSHFHVPTWLVAIPAAAIIGFVLGLWTQDNQKGNESLTALVDTVYIKVSDPQPSQDSVAQAIPTSQTTATSRPVTRRAEPSSRRAIVPPSPRTPVPSYHRTTVPSYPRTTVGRPVADDHIRYDLLVRN